MLPPFLSRLGQLGQRAVQNVMPVPNALQGLLTPDDISNARRMGLLGFGSALLDASGPGPGMTPAPGIAQALGRGLQTGLGTYQQQLTGAAQGNVQSLQFNRQQQLEQQRDAIQQRYASMPNGPDKLKAMFNDFVQIGDMEMVGKLAQVMPSLMTSKKAVEHVDLGDRVQVINPDTGEVLREIPKGITPKTPAEVDMGMRFKADQRNKILDDYARDTKDFHQVMSGWKVLEGATKDPTLATPFAVTDAYARITNPGAIVRPTTMEMINQMGSLGTKMRKYWEQNANGALPADVLNDFKKTLYNIVKEHHDQYQQIRRKAILRAKGSGIDDIDSLLEDYSLVDPTAPNGSAPAGGKKTGSAQVRQFLK